MPEDEIINLITKDLEFGCLFYEISDTGRLLRDNEDGTYRGLKPSRTETYAKCVF